MNTVGASAPEGIKDSWEVLWGYPHACVLKGQRDAIVVSTSGDDETSTVRHRVNRILR